MHEKNNTQAMRNVIYINGMKFDSYTTFRIDRKQRETQEGETVLS